MGWWFKFSLLAATLFPPLLKMAQNYPDHMLLECIVWPMWPNHLFSATFGGVSLPCSGFLCVVCYMKGIFGRLICKGEGNTLIHREIQNSNIHIPLLEVFILHHPPQFLFQFLLTCLCSVIQATLKCSYKY